MSKKRILKKIIKSISIRKYERCSDRWDLGFNEGLDCSIELLKKELNKLKEN